MARLALERWRELEDQAGQELLRVVGGWTSARRPRPRRARSRRPASGSNGHRTPRSPSDGRCCGSHRVRASSTSPTAPSCAPRRPSGCWLAGRDHGAEVREETSVESVTPAGEGVEVTTRDGVIVAPVAIVAAGVVDRPLLAPAGISLDLRPTLEQSTHFDADARDLPTVIDWDEAPEEPPYIVPTRSSRGGSRPARTCRAGPSIRRRDRSRPTSPASNGSSTGSAAASCPRLPCSGPRRASTRGRGTRTSCSTGSDRSWSPHPAAATGSSSRR